MNHCAASEMLGAYALRACSARERRDVERHLAVCPTCAAELETLSDVVRLLDEGRPTEPGRDRDR